MGRHHIGRPVQATIARALLRDDDIRSDVTLTVAGVVLQLGLMCGLSGPAIADAIDQATAAIELEAIAS